ncbi:MAG: murein biosynthesis integral membrane protein MurJ [Firmicutes bacterium]|nr:murein biosynthesis integral membrane protein MurJ [Bacillota bacterium]
MGKSLLRAVGVILIVNIGVKLLGFLKELFIANAFGASSLSDAYLVAYTIPYFVHAIFGYALLTAVVPHLTRALGQADGELLADRIGSSLINLTALAMLGVSAIGIIAAPLLVQLTAPGLDAATAAMAADMTRIIFPSVIFMGMGMVVSGILNSRHDFAAAAAAVGMPSLAIIIVCLLADAAQVELLAWGTLLGYLLFLLIQLPSLKFSGFRYRMVADFGNSAVRGVCLDIMPIMLGVAVNHVYTLVNRIFASQLPAGSISALNYAAKLVNMPQSVFVGAVAIGIYPLLSEAAQKKQSRELSETLSRGLGMVMIIAIPAALGLLVLSEPIVRLVFESGSFNAEDTAITAHALEFLAPALLFYSANMLLTRVCYATDDVRTPLVAGLVSIAANIGISLLLLDTLASGGLALANTLGAAVNMLILLLMLRPQLQGLFGAMRGDTLKMTAAGALMAVICLFARPLLPTAGRAALGVWLLGLIGAACLIYFIALKALRCSMLDEVLGVVKRKIKKA